MSCYKNGKRYFVSFIDDLKLSIFHIHLNEKSQVQFLSSCTASRVIEIIANNKVQ
uniref:Uncharacterized protein n=1 Tax=Rhizophora mucronata TaxID=61149 RepID=A0A2P2PF95_RHIMU